jgi:hypothetical protein
VCPKGGVSFEECSPGATGLTLEDRIVRGEVSGFRANTKAMTRGAWIPD